MAAALDTELYRLYDRMVEWHAEEDDQPSRTDQQVWQVYRKEFDRRGLLQHLTPVTIQTPTYDYSFDYAWKDERWYAIEPISLDLVHGRSILEKANRWIGRATNLADSQDFERLYMVIGGPAPDRHDAMQAYKKSVANLREKIPLDLEIIEEKDAFNFASRLAKLVYVPDSPL